MAYIHNDDQVVIEVLLPEVAVPGGRRTTSSCSSSIGTTASQWLLR